MKETVTVPVISAFSSRKVKLSLRSAGAQLSPCVTAVTAIHSASTCHSQSGGSGCASSGMTGASFTYSSPDALNLWTTKEMFPLPSSEKGSSSSEVHHAVLPSFRLPGGSIPLSMAA